MSITRTVAVVGFSLNALSCSSAQFADEEPESVETGSEALTQSLSCCIDEGVAAVTTSVTRTDIFGRATDGAIWRRTCLAPTCSPSQWTGWVREPGLPSAGTKGRPAAISMRSGRIDVFTRGLDDSVWQRTWWFNTTGWTSWFRVANPGNANSAPGLSSTGTDSLDFYVKSGPEIWTRRCSSYQNECTGNSAFGAWRSLGEPAPGVHTTHSDPAVVNLGGGTLVAFVTGADSALYRSWFIAGFWGPWESAGGILWSSPATPPDRPEVYVRGRDNHVWRNSLDIGWEHVKQPGLSPNVLSSLAVAGSLPVIDVFGVNPSTSEAWEFTCSNTKYEPTRWNDLFCGGDGCGGQVQLNNNCYNYALDRITGTNAIPGRWAGEPHPSMGVTMLRQNALADGLRWVGWSFPGNTFNCHGGHLVHLGVKPNVDFHWWRLDRQQGTWSHKIGTNPVSNRDASGAIITNPLTSNRFGYNDNGGFYCGCGDLATIR